MSSYVYAQGGSTPLMEAAEQGQAATVLVLVEAGADMDLEDRVGENEIEIKFLAAHRHGFKVPVFVSFCLIHSQLQRARLYFAIFPPCIQAYLFSAHS